MREIRIRVPDISCGHCVAAVEGALKGLDGVDNVEVSLEDKTAKVFSGKEIDPSAILSAVREAGYTPELEG